MQKIISFLKNIFKFFGIGITSYESLERLLRAEKELESMVKAPTDLKIIQEIAQKNYSKSIKFLEKSKSQLKQDLFVLSETNFKKNGFFVEFGATNGLDGSNTFLLESEFNWHGILAEPAKIWIKQLKKNRPNSLIETKCLWSKSNEEIVFNEVNNPEYSTVQSFRKFDSHVNSRSKFKKYKVSTISLNDLLLKYEAPRYIDYLSIDTEGSEYEILKDFDFKAYFIKVITVEHNFSLNRDKINYLLTINGYVQKFKTLSRFDDWYVKID